MHKKIKTTTAFSIVAFILSVFPHFTLALPNSESTADDRLINAASTPSNWLLHGGDYAEKRYSTLQQINKKNIKQLGLAWSFEFPDNRGLEATPLVDDGVIYTTGSWSRVFAHNAKTGELLWRYDPKISRSILPKACCGPVNRGAALWGDSVFVGGLDGTLFSLDKKTGELQWQVQTTNPDKDYTITGAPRVVKGNVIIGNGGAEYGVRGYVSAYDAKTGKLNWRFYTVPGDPADGFENKAMAQAAKTWNGKWWALGGGGTVWDSISFDPELNLLYVGVGNGSPWNQEIRSPGGGDNLYLSSIVALNPDTGEYVWHYQTTPGESWDFTAAQQMTLADINWQGEKRKVLMQAPKNGFFFILDRETGEFLSAEPFTKVLWASHYDSDGRPVENPDARYKTKAAFVAPSAVGGHNWHSMSYSPNTGLVYIPVIKSMMKYQQPINYNPQPSRHNFGADLPADEILNSDFMSVLKDKIIRGELLAWDPEKQKAVWRYQHNRTWNGGTLATAGGLVFQGTADHKMMAFDAKTGSVLWEFNTQLAIVAAPISYEVDGEQYIAIAAKWGGGGPLGMGLKPILGLKNGRLLVFKLNGQSKLPANDEKALVLLSKPAEQTINDAAKIAHGKKVYDKYCSICHGIGVVSSGGVPDLRYTVGNYPFSTFKAIALDGVLSGSGMDGFSDVVSQQEAEEIYNYILQESEVVYQNQLEKNTLLYKAKWWSYNKIANFIVMATDGTKGFYLILAFMLLLLVLLLFMIIRKLFYK